jgi:hypothetical protein
MKKTLLLFCAAILTIFTQCDTLKGLPTNTSGGLFTLNGNWQLATTNDANAMQGTVLQVVPGFSDATVKTLNNNTYCLRERDAAWRNIKSLQGGTFTIDNLVNACNGSTLYKQAIITVQTNDEIVIKGSSATNNELSQTWRRVPNQ